MLGGAIDDQHWVIQALAYLEQYGGRPGQLWLCCRARFDTRSISPCSLPPPKLSVRR